MKTTFLFVLSCMVGSAFAGDSIGSLDEAKQLAQKENKPLLIEFYAPG